MAIPNNKTGPERHVLVIAYYFPPMGLSGVQRVSKFVKYLSEYGWKPTILTVNPAGYYAYDETLLAELQVAGIRIYRTASWDPTRLFGSRRVVSMPSETHRSWTAAISQFLFIPDNKIGWMPHALRMGNRLLHSESFDLIFSSAPPFTGHLIAARLARKYQRPLVIDFRDDWLTNPRHVYPTGWHKRYHARMESYVFKQCSHVVTINDAIRDAFEERHANPTISVIPHGYDPAMFAIEPARRESQKMQFLYSGIFYDAQTPDYFLRALAQLLRHHPAIRDRIEAVFVGLLPAVSRQLISDLSLADIVRYEDYVPHTRAVALQRSADVLWMTIGSRPGAEGISTSKLFEYMGSRKPILALVPPGVARNALAQYGAAVMASPEDVNAIEDAMLRLFEAWQSNALPTPNEAYVERFDRRQLTKTLAACFDACLMKQPFV